MSCCATPTSHIISAHLLYNLHPSAHIKLNPTILATGPVDYYYTTQETDKVLVIMGPSSAFLLALIGVTFIQTHGVKVPDGECPPDQVYNECGSACYSPCGERDPDLMCTDQCVPGCYCQPGFTFLEGSNRNKCVPCNPTPTVPDSECPPDQVYDECRSACSSPCGKRRPDRICTQQCVTGCFCKPGFTFLEGSNKSKCVPCKPTLKG